MSTHKKFKIPRVIERYALYLIIVLLGVVLMGLMREAFTYAKFEEIRVLYEGR